MLHIRAIVRDRNDVTGPGIGTSDTRTLRIARSDEYDSVAVDPAPPPEAEKNALSQRMLLMMAQALEQKRPKISRGDPRGRVARHRGRPDAAAKTRR